MTERDAWARLTPYEVGIPGREFADRTFTRIRQEVEGRVVDPADPDAFLLLGEVGRAVREIQGEERGGDALERFGRLLFHAYHFHAAGERLLLLETSLVRRLVGDAPGASEWQGELPADAGYLQLPRHLVWAHPDPDGPPEDVDGVFWARCGEDALALLLALGIRPDRPGISVVPLPVAPMADAPSWPELDGRDQGEDFRTTLPGGELDQLYSILSVGEALKLVSRIFAYLLAHPEAMGAREEAPEDREAAGPGEVRPSLLPYRRVRDVGAGAEGRERNVDPRTERRERDKGPGAEGRERDRDVGSRAEPRDRHRDAGPSTEG